MYEKFLAGLASIAEVKAAVDLSAVVLAYGIELTAVGDHKLVGLCPFHDDTEPSFSVWLTEQGEWSCGCWACDFGPGDLFTFLMRWHECGFSEALRTAVALDLDDLPEPSKISAEKIVRAVVSLDRILSRGTETQAVGELLLARGIDVPSSWVEQEFGVCADGDTVLIPHWDEHGTLIGLKRRAAYMGWKNIAARGSEFTALYGAFRPMTKQCPAIVCEGESDTWSVSWWYKGIDIAVFGLPCGVNAAPRKEWLELLEGRTVILLFDADRAGQEGSLIWRSVLKGQQVFTADLPWGTDATTAGPDVVYDRVANAA